MSKIKQKATRILKNLQFTGDTHNVSLVGPEVGSGANQTKVLLLKQVLKKEETIEVKKALEQVSLNISMEEFLRKFFNLYHSDAEVLTKLLGFETEHDAWMKQQKEREDEYDWAEEHNKWIESRVSQFTLMKSMNDGTITEISKSAFNEIVALQQKLEPALVEHFMTKGKQMEELELAKSALTAKEAELATQVELTKSLEAKVAELEQAIAVQKAAEEKAQLDAFTEQLKDLVAEDKLESVAKALFAMQKVDADVVAVQIETLKAAKQSAKVIAENLNQESGHSEVTKSEDVELAEKQLRIQKALDRLSK